MNFSRGFLALGAVLTALAGALCLFPGAAARLGLDFWTLPDLGVQLQRDEAYGTELDREAEEALGRVAAKEEAARGVMEGRLALGQAAARFRALDAGAPPRARQAFAERFPGVPEDERCCREVIAWVVEVEQRGPGGGTNCSRRLTAELEDALRHGPLSLPDPVPAAYPDPEGTPPPAGAAAEQAIPGSQRNTLRNNQPAGAAHDRPAADAKPESGPSFH